jgi:hypothetical protein
MPPERLLEIEYRGRDEKARLKRTYEIEFSPVRYDSNRPLRCHLGFEAYNTGKNDQGDIVWEGKKTLMIEGSAEEIRTLVR